jgi:UDP-glucose 4-epimerase
MRSAVVTGGAGFIGSALVYALVKQNVAVTVVDNLSTGSRENLSGLPSEVVRLEVADIGDIQKIMPVLKGSDVVFHLACLGVRHSLTNPLENHAVNATGTLNLVRAAMDANVPRFVHVSTSEVYGTARTVPLDEKAPCYPHTVYGASKLAGECYVRAMHDTYDYPVVIFRPFNAYGPRCHHEGDSGEVIPRFLLQCLAGQKMIVFGDGMQTRDFTFVDETAFGIMQGGLRDSVLGKTVNLGSGKEITVNELARTVISICESTNLNIEHRADRPGDVRRLLADSSRAKALLDWNPQITLSEGILRLRSWYENSDETPEKLLENVLVSPWND